MPRRRAITGTFKIRVVQPEQPVRETDMNRTAGVDVKLPFAMTGPKTTAGNGMFQMTKVVASGGDLWPADDRHGDGVEIFAVDEKRVPKESLTHEANLVVERDR